MRKEETVPNVRYYPDDCRSTSNPGQSRQCSGRYLKTLGLRTQSRFLGRSFLMAGFGFRHLLCLVLATGLLRPSKRSLDLLLQSRVCCRFLLYAMGRTDCDVLRLSDRAPFSRAFIGYGQQPGATNSRLKYTTTGAQGWPQTPQGPRQFNLNFYEEATEVTRNVFFFFRVQLVPNEFFCLLDYYAASGGLKLTFRNYLSTPFSRVKLKNNSVKPRR